MDQSQIAGLLGQALPVQYQGGLEDIRRRKMIAEALQMQSMQAQPTEVITGHAVPQSKMGNIARLLTGGLGAYQSSQAQGQINQVQNQAANDEQSGAAQLSQMFQQNPRQAVIAARSSPFPSHKAMGQGWEKMLQEQQLAGGKVLGESGDIRGALDALTQGIPPNYTGPERRQPEFGSVPGPNGAIATVTNFDKMGVPKANFGPGAAAVVNVDARVPGQEVNTALNLFEKDATRRQEAATLAKDALASNRHALEALNEGAKVGGLGGLKQAARKIAQGFNLSLNDKDLTSTESIQMALGNAVLANARKLAPVTELDMVKLEQILGSVNTDPTALERALTLVNGAALRNIQNYNTFMDTSRNDPEQGKYIKGMANRLASGFELLPPGGNMTQQMMALQELKALGGDVGKFQIGNTPIPADAEFDMGGFGKGKSATKGSAANPMTYQEYQEYLKGGKK